jgi:hypothetical protein
LTLIGGRVTIAGSMKLACRLVVLLALMPPGASAQDGATGTPNPLGSSAIEQALIEHACLSRLPGIAGADAYQECLSGRLRSLRADYGRDLSQVSPADRNALDAACGKTRQAEGREAYLECLTVQLASIRNRRRGVNPATSQETALPAPLQSVQSATLAAPVGGTSSSSRAPLWIGVMLVALVVAGSGAFMAMKGRRAIRKCRVCGAIVPGVGDLCPTCRREAADVLRHAATDRAEHDRARAEDQRRQSEREEELRQRLAREEEDARLRKELEGSQRDESRRQLEEEQEASRRRIRAAALDSENESDPYTILGVSRDAGKEVIEAARQAVLLKYAPEHVAHLGPELQEHYKRKAEAVERAYRILSK